MNILNHLIPGRANDGAALAAGLGELLNNCRQCRGLNELCAWRGLAAVGRAQAEPHRGTALRA
jgi:hypothetical protein